MISLAAQYAATTVWLGSHQWDDPTDAEVAAMDAETDAARRRCALHLDETACPYCCHNDCDWCPTCNPGDTR